MKHDSLQFIADTTFITTGTIAGFHASEMIGFVVAMTNLVYVIVRLIDKFKNKQS